MASQTMTSQIRFNSPQFLPRTPSTAPLNLVPYTPLPTPVDEFSLGAPLLLSPGSSVVPPLNPSLKTLKRKKRCDEYREKHNKTDQRGRDRLKAALTELHDLVNPGKKQGFRVETIQSGSSFIKKLKAENELLKSGGPVASLTFSQSPLEDKQQAIIEQQKLENKRQQKKIRKQTAKIEKLKLENTQLKSAKLQIELAKFQVEQERDRNFHELSLNLSKTISGVQQSQQQLKAELLQAKEELRIRNEQLLLYQRANQLSQLLQFGTNP